VTAGETRHGAAIRKVLWITLDPNVAVAAAKIAVGSAVSTLSVLADGYHSLPDGSGNVVGLVAIRFAHKPSRRRSPRRASKVRSPCVEGDLARPLRHRVRDRVLEAARIRAAVLERPGVTSCGRIRTRGLPDPVFLDRTIGMNPGLSLREAHTLCDGIEAILKARFPELGDIVIHLGPAPEPEARGEAAGTPGAKGYNG